MSECPECCASLQWFGGTNVSPETKEGAYICPDQSCRVGLVRVVVDE